MIKRIDYKATPFLVVGKWAYSTLIVGSHTKMSKYWFTGPSKTPANPNHMIYRCIFRERVIPQKELWICRCEIDLEAVVKYIEWKTVFLRYKKSTKLILKGIRSSVYSSALAYKYEHKYCRIFNQNTIFTVEINNVVHILRSRTACMWR